MSTPYGHIPQRACVCIHHIAFHLVTYIIAILKLPPPSPPPSASVPTALGYQAGVRKGGIDSAKVAESQSSSGICIAGVGRIMLFECVDGGGGGETNGQGAETTLTLEAS